MTTISPGPGRPLTLGFRRSRIASATSWADARDQQEYHKRLTREGDSALASMLVESFSRTMRRKVVTICCVLVTVLAAPSALAQRRRAVRHPAAPADIFLLQEDIPGSIFSMSTTCPPAWSIDHQELLRQFSAKFANTDYDFLVLIPVKAPLCYNYSVIANQDITGIGRGCTPCANELAPHLKAFAVIDLFHFWKALIDLQDDPQRVVPMFLHTIIHEIGHYWLVFIKGLQAGDGVHWPSNLDLFAGDPRYADPMADYHWIVRDSQEICVNANDPAVIGKFSDVSLYLMGLLPADAVHPISEHVFTPKPGDDIYNRYGPNCADAHHFVTTRTITVADIIALNGVRTPSYDASPAAFRSAFVVLSAAGESPPQAFLEYVKIYTASLPQAWSLATSGHSEMSIVSVIPR